MTKLISVIGIFWLCLVHQKMVMAQQTVSEAFTRPLESAKPWAIWYWMYASVSKEGITADLEAMKRVGIGGAYLMSIKDTASRIPFEPQARQLTPEWWAMVNHAMREAKRLDLKLAMHASDGFALAGGPWIKPDMAMQKLVWSSTFVSSGEKRQQLLLKQPEAFENYYEDVAVLAYPAVYGNSPKPFQIISSTGDDASFLVDENADATFRSNNDCYIEYRYAQPFTMRSVRIKASGTAYLALKPTIQYSQDGEVFHDLLQLTPPRHGWQDNDEDNTFSVTPVSAKYFRFVYTKIGVEPGAEDLDAAKWTPNLKVKGIYPGEQPVINAYEGKNGSVWRIGESTREFYTDDSIAVPLKNIIDLSGKVAKDGTLEWIPPPGNWVVVRIGHTATGHTNYTGGGGLGLECDKFNKAAVQLQFDNWFRKAFDNTDPSLAKEVLSIFHLDSWECGSQNWTKEFPAYFKAQHGYDLLPYLLTMTGVPVETVEKSETVLHDVRETIATLVHDVFYTTLKENAHALGCSFSGEAIAPTMMSDGILHYKQVDLPMGEFWLNSPTHDKMNDMLDAISGAHVYGKKIVGAEAYTTLRMDWTEHPGMLKALGDRNFAFGVNKMALHVFTQNPWMDKKPGMTLDGIGLYYQRDQTWFEQSKAWIAYMTRCSALLQLGNPVRDVAVFIGEEMPRRAVLPDRLVSVLPGIFGKQRVASEAKRLANINTPLREIPDGVRHSANMADPGDWVDPMHGYQYDSFNPDVLMQMKVNNGSIVIPGIASYGVLIVPGKRRMDPTGKLSNASIEKLIQLALDGGKLIVDQQYAADFAGIQNIWWAPFTDSSFSAQRIQRDVEISAEENTIAWTHRKWNETDIYFLSNQTHKAQAFEISFATEGKQLDIYDPVKATTIDNYPVTIKQGRLATAFTLAPSQSLFFVFEKEKDTVIAFDTSSKQPLVIPLTSKQWTVTFDKDLEGGHKPFVTNGLKSWTTWADSSMKYYCGNAVYTTSFKMNSRKHKQVALAIDSVYNIASVKLNGIDCGTIWTAPYQVDITKALRRGKNHLEITVANTWHNRLIGDANLPEEKRLTYTIAPFRLSGKPLLPAGLVGNVKLVMQ